MTARLGEYVYGEWQLEHVMLPQTLPRSWYMRTEASAEAPDRVYDNSGAFWADVYDESLRTGKNVKLDGFRVFEWVPRNPGLYFHPQAKWQRQAAQDNLMHIHEADFDAYARAADAPADHAEIFRQLTKSDEPGRKLIYTPRGKVLMLEGGLGCIRLKPVEFKQGGTYWWMGATSTLAPDEGIPIALPDHLYRQMIDEIVERGYATADVTASIEFVPDEYTDHFGKYYGIPRLYLKVQEVQRSSYAGGYGLVSVAASFVSDFEGDPGIYATYVTFEPSTKGARRSAATWLEEEYVKGLHRGHILTDFDQQSPAFGNRLFGLDDILASPDLADQILKLKKHYGRFDWSMLEKMSFSFVRNEADVMVKIKNTGSMSGFAVVTGDNARADISQGDVVQKTGIVPLPEMADALHKIRIALKDEPETAEVDMIKGAVAKAEMAASNNDNAGMKSALSELQPFAKKVIAIAETIGVGVATAALKSALGY
ncbi:hypothetical protein E0H62_33700 [Rhizobium leguminosarum bv. viciae]|nr:hypothetical protein E0H62_33700 [Rhizobium leguminosarum bv. viciae]